MYIDIVLLCVDCVLASPRIAQADPGRRTPPRGHSVTLIIEQGVLSCPLTQSFTPNIVFWQAPYPKIYYEWGTAV
jgi:hypothetical protein